MNVYLGLSFKWCLYVLCQPYEEQEKRLRQCYTVLYEEAMESTA